MVKPIGQNGSNAESLRASGKDLTSSGWQGYGLAVGVTALAALARWALSPVWGPLPPFITFYPALMLCAILGGTGPGLLATVLATLTAKLLFIEPLGQLAVSSSADTLALVIFFGIGMALSFLGGRWQVTRRQLHQVAQFVIENPNPVLRLNQQGQLLYANQAGRALLTHPVAPDKLRQVAAIALQSGQREEFDLAGPNGCIFFVSLPLPAKNYVNFYGHDVTEARRAEAALRESQAKLQGIVSSAMDAIISIDAQQRVVIFNSAAERMFRCAASTALGASLDQFIPARFREVHRHHVESFARTGVTARKMGGANVLVGLRADGQEFPIEASISQIQCGSDKFLTVILRDITERVQAEEALRRSETLYRAIARSIPEGGVWVVDSNLRALVAEGPLVARLGQAREALEGRTLHEVFAEPLLRIVEPRFRQALCGEPASYETDFGACVVWTQYVPLRKESGTVVAAMALALDITERKQAQQALERARDELARANADLEGKVVERTAKLQEMVEELERFSYALVHDMRAPLRAMRSFAEILQQEYGPALPAGARSFLERINTSSSRMDTLITDALSYSRAVREHLPLEPVALAPLLRGMVESYPNFQPPHADIHIEDDLPLVLGNQAALTQCFSNLLANAVKFVDPGTHPRVRIWAELRPFSSGPQGSPPVSAIENRSSEGRDDLVRIWVQDNGLGIPKAAHQRIFDMFQRLHTGYEGTGIGLAIVRKVVKHMGGRIGVESEPGQGSRFWVELNRAE